MVVLLLASGFTNSTCRLIGPNVTYLMYKLYPEFWGFSDLIERIHFILLYVTVT